MSINKCVFLGRMTADIELRTTQSGKKVTTFSIALDRGGKDKGADFPICIAWEAAAEFIGKYFSKGDWIAVEARVQTRTYEDKNGQKRGATEFIVERVSFAGAKKQDGQGAGSDNRSPFHDFGGGPEFIDMADDDGELPF